MERLSIGVLAHNEGARIGHTIASLARQSIFRDGVAAAAGLAAIELVIVPNGCTDDTAAAAEAATASLPATVTATVRPLDKAGKANAWNRYVHDLSSSGATIMVLMDADIDLAAPEAIEKLVRRLRDDPSAAVTTDIPTKDFRGKRLSLLDRISQRASRQRAGGTGICGQLYCARATTLRRIWLPANLPVEDGFLAAMVKTDGFTREPVDDVVSCVDDTMHYYEPVEGIGGFVRHEARILVGSVINAWLYTVLWREGRSGHVGDYVRARNAAEPDWLEQICRDEKARRGWWLIPNSFVFGRLYALRGQPAARAIRRAPVAVAATLATLPACWRANGILRRTAATRYW